MDGLDGWMDDRGGGLYLLATRLDLIQSSISTSYMAYSPCYHLLICLDGLCIIALLLHREGEDILSIRLIHVLSNSHPPPYLSITTPKSDGLVMDR